MKWKRYLISDLNSHLSHTVSFIAFKLLCPLLATVIYCLGKVASVQPMVFITYVIYMDVINASQVEGRGAYFSRFAHAHCWC